MAQEMNREETLDRLEEKAGDYEERFASCSQGTLLALQETFNLGNAQVLKATTDLNLAKGTATYPIKPSGSAFCIMPSQISTRIGSPQSRHGLSI
ncbi:MAG: hypothetical protein FD159_1860 [Syntrophaceae bacterium]|nr:MAG: hypothetical protein FD159_1860 [Syntrophaceae bacterium]